MALQTSFPMSMADVAAEMGNSLPISLRDADVRALAGTGTGPISMSDLLGKSAATFNGLTESGGTTANGVPFGAAKSSRQVVCVIHFSTDGSSANLSMASATIGGVSATIRAQHGARLGVGGNLAILTAIISANVPSGTSGTVSVSIPNSTGSERISIGSWTTYRPLTSVVTTSASAGSADSVSINLPVPSNGMAIAGAVQYATVNTLNISGLSGGATAYNNDGNQNLRAAAQWGDGLSSGTRNVTASANTINSGMTIVGIAWSPG